MSDHVQLMSEPCAKRKRPSFDLFDIYGDKESSTSIIDIQPRGIENLINEEIRKYGDMKVTLDGSHLDFDLLKWWQKNNTQLPLLCKLSRFIHSIPASSSPSERVFSTAGNVVTNKRSRLSPESVNSILMLKSNWDLLSN